MRLLGSTGILGYSELYRNATGKVYSDKNIWIDVLWLLGNVCDFYNACFLIYPWNTLCYMENINSISMQEVEDFDANVDKIRIQTK